LSEEPVEEIHRESLEEAVTHTTDEARMVLPGVQAILGFQLIAVFNQKFEQLSQGLQLTHLIAFALLALAMGLLMTPAAYHRTRQRTFVTRRFLVVASALLAGALFPLLLGLSLDAYVLAYIVTKDVYVSLGLSIGIFAVIGGLWYVFPRLVDRERPRRSQGDRSSVASG
jgi:hypothetical protein